MEGVATWDVAKVEGQRQFHLRTILMWTIHDYPRYGLVVGCVDLAYKACAICGPYLTSRHYQELNKVVYERSCC
jgi:hypothetical protein